MFPSTEELLWKSSRDGNCQNFQLKFKRAFTSTNINNGNGRYNTETCTYFFRVDHSLRLLICSICLLHKNNFRTWQKCTKCVRESRKFQPVLKYYHPTMYYKQTVVTFVFIFFSFTHHFFECRHTVTIFLVHQHVSSSKLFVVLKHIHQKGLPVYSLQLPSSYYFSVRFNVIWFCYLWPLTQSQVHVNVFS